MIKGYFSLLGAAALVSVSVQAAQPSFDCGKAEHEVEELICKDGELAALDRSLTSLYAKVYENTPAAERKRLKAEQIGWIKGRDDCWKADDQRACVKDEYEMRIRELKDR